MKRLRDGMTGGDIGVLGINRLRLAIASDLNDLT